MPLTEKQLERSMQIVSEFTAWTPQTGPCPIDVHSLWFKRLCALGENIAVLETLVNDLSAEIEQDKLKAEVPADIDKIASNLREMRLMGEINEMRKALAAALDVTPDYPDLLNPQHAGEFVKMRLDGLRDRIGELLHTLSLYEDFSKRKVQEIAALKDRVVVFAAQLQAWGYDEAAKELIDEVLGGPVEAPDYYAVKTRAEKVESILSMFADENHWQHRAGRWIWNGSVPPMDLAKDEWSEKDGTT